MIRGMLWRVMLLTLVLLMVSPLLLARRKRLSSVERRFPSNWCPIVAEGFAGDLFGGSFAMEFVADARRGDFLFTADFGFNDAPDLGAYLDNVIILDADRIPDLANYAIQASALGIECDPDGFSLNLDELRRDLPEAIVFEEHFSDLACSDSPARRCWTQPSGVAFSDTSAPDHPGSGSLADETGSLFFSSGSASLTSTVSISSFEVGRRYLLTGWWLSDFAQPDVELAIELDSTPEAPGHDICFNSEVIGASPFQDVVVTEGALGSDPGEPTSSCGEVGRTVWYEFTAPRDGLIVLDTVGSDFDTQITVFTGSCSAPSQVGCSNDQSGGVRAARQELIVRAGETYRFQVGGVRGAGGTLSLVFDFSDAYQLFFPQVAVGPDISTTLSLLATSATTATDGLLTLFDPSGAPLTANSGEATESQFDVPLAAGGTRFMTLTGPPPTRSGWGLYLSDKPVNGVASFELRDSAGRLLSVAGVLGTTPLRGARLPVEDAAETGVAIANPTDTAVRVRLSALDTQGQTPSGVADQVLEIDPRGQTSAFAGQILGNFQGSLRIQVEGPGRIVVTGLVVKPGGLLTAIPVIRD